MNLSYLFSLEPKQSSVMLRRSTCCLNQIPGIVLIRTEHPLTFHLPLITASQPSRESHRMTHRAEYKWLRQPLCRQWCMVVGDYVLLYCHSPAIPCPQSWRIFQSGFLLIHCKCTCLHWKSLCHPLLKSENPNQPTPVLLRRILISRSHTLTSHKSFQQRSTQWHHRTWHFLMNSYQQPN